MNQSQDGAAGASPSTQSTNSIGLAPTAKRPQRPYRRMGVPYRLNSGLWAIRARHREQMLCLSGFTSQSDARAALVRRLLEPDQGERHARETVAQALQQYGLAHLPRLRNPLQEARTINTYLRAAGERIIEVRPSMTAGAPRQKTMFGRDFVLTLVHAPTVGGGERSGGEPDYRMTRSARLRSELARTRMADVTSSQIQAFLQALEDEGRARATVMKERGLLGRLFKYARRYARDSSSARNPVPDVWLHGSGRKRLRKMTASERERLEAAFKAAGDADAARMFVFLAETRVDAKYCVEHACWDEILWGARIFRRRGSSGLSSVVFLSDQAIGILQEMGPPDDSSRKIFGMNYPAFKRAWLRACRASEVEDLRVQDLRRTACHGWNFPSEEIRLVILGCSRHPRQGWLGQHVAP